MVWNKCKSQMETVKGVESPIQPISPSERFMFQQTGIHYSPAIACSLCSLHHSPQSHTIKRALLRHRHFLRYLKRVT